MAIVQTATSSTTFANAASASYSFFSAASGIVGEQIIHYAVFDNLTATTPTISTIARPAGETNNWALLASLDSPQAAAGGGVRIEIWGITTTVAWVNGTSRAVTLSGSVTVKAYGSSSFTGADLSSVTAQSAALGANITQATTIGNLYLHVSGSENNAALTLAPLTANVTWMGAANSGFSTGGGATANAAITWNYGIATTATSPTWSASGGSDGGHIVLEISPLPTTNDFEGPGTSGQNVTAQTTGSLTDNPISAVTLSGTSTATFATTPTLVDAQSLKFSWSSAAAGYVTWNHYGTGVNNRQALRFYYYYPSGQTFTGIDLLGVRSASAYVLRMWFDGTGKLQVADSTSAVIATASSAMPLNTLIRVEVSWTVGTTTSNGQVSMDYYLGHSTTPIQTVVSSTTANLGTALTTNVRLGTPTNVGAAAVAYYDDFAVQELASGYIGPSQSIPAYNGTATLSGSGAITTSGVVALASTATLPGAGSITETHSLSGGPLTGTSSLSGTGSTTASGVVARFSTATISGTGSISASGVVGVSSTATRSGTGSVTASGATGISSTSSLNGSGSTITSGATGVSSTVSFSGTGSITETHSLAGGPLTGSASLTGGNSITVTAVKGLNSTATLTGVDSITPTGVVGLSSSASLAGTGSITTSGTASVTSTATVPGTGSINASGGGATAQTSSLSGTGAITASGVVARFSTATLSGTDTITASGNANAATTASLAGTGSVTATGVLGLVSTASLTGAGNANAVGSTLIASTATLQGTDSVTAVGSAAYTGTAALSGTGSTTDVGSTLKTSTATISGTDTITTSGIAASGPSSVLTGAGSIIASGLVAKSTTASLAGTDTITASGSTNLASTATLSGTVTTTASGSTLKTSTSTVQGTDSITTSGVVAGARSASVAGTGSISAQGVLGLSSTASLQGTGSVGAVGAVSIYAAVVLIGLGIITLAGGVPPDGGYPEIPLSRTISAVIGTRSIANAGQARTISRGP